MNRVLLFALTATVLSISSFHFPKSESASLASASHEVRQANTSAQSTNTKAEAPPFRSGEDPALSYESAP